MTYKMIPLLPVLQQQSRSVLDSVVLQRHNEVLLFISSFMLISLLVRCCTCYGICVDVRGQLDTMQVAGIEISSSGLVAIIFNCQVILVD